ncbi:hypothetical protein CLOM_g5703 [Closterium sp. NIES-68]|nr:hypothetical protein CLOM_g5703 [Closterium sp. NIES-68]
MERRRAVGRQPSLRLCMRLAFALFLLAAHAERGLAAASNSTSGGKSDGKSGGNGGGKGGGHSGGTAGGAKKGSTHGAKASANEAGKPAGDGIARLVLLRNNSFGAKCLDGSPPGYYRRVGYGGGTNSWHIHFPGGGWCATRDECAERATTFLGSTKYMPQSSQGSWVGGQMTGILSPRHPENKLFYNWNLALLAYCDGGGYAGSAGKVAVKSSGKSAVFMQGDAIVKAVLQDLNRTKGGLGSAARILVSGCSAGGFPVTRLCDSVAAAHPKANVKCMIDGGFFLDAKDRQDGFTFRSIIQNVSSLHRFTDSKCSQGMEAWKCMLPEYSLKTVSRPVFITNALFDYTALKLYNQLRDTTYQVNNRCLRQIIWSQGSLQKAVTSNQWKPFNPKPGECDATSRSIIQATVTDLFNRMKSSVEGEKNLVGFLASDCVGHCVATTSQWFSPPRNNTYMKDAVVNWFKGKLLGGKLYF